MATIREIAAKAGFSSATVSRILNDDATFSTSEVTRAKVLKIARELNYHQPVRQHQQFKIGVFFSISPQQELEDSYYSDVRRSLILAADAADMQLLFYPKVEDARYKTIDGYVAVGHFSVEDLTSMQQFSENNIFIDVNPNPDAFNAIQPNYEHMIHRAVNEFQKKHLNRIGFVGARYWNAYFPADPRTTYFESYMRSLGLFDESLMFVGESFSVSTGYKVGLKIVDSLKDHTLPQGFIVSSDPLSVGLLQAFNKNKITVPDDTQIISINDISIAQFVSPPLTTFRIDTHEIGRLAIDILKDTILFPNAHKRTVALNSELIYRDSFPRIED